MNVGTSEANLLRNIFEKETNNQATKRRNSGLQWKILDEVLIPIQQLMSRENLMPFLLSCYSLGTRKNVDFEQRRTAATGGEGRRARWVEATKEASVDGS